jgi:hypothetical protein
MASGAPEHDIGKDFEIADPADWRTPAAHGGTVPDWLPLENMLMRRRITHILLVILPVALAACVYAMSQGAPALSVLAIALLVAAPLGVAVRYYFHETAE